MLNDNAFKEIISQIQAQYRDTNIKELLEGIAEIVEKYAFNCMNSLEKDGLNLATARGDFLDLWGDILGISGYMPISEDRLPQTFFNFYNKHFIRLQFYYKDSSFFERMADNDFRKLLLFLAQKMYNCGDVKDINIFLKAFTAEFGSVFSIRDTTDMSFYYIYFQQEIPAWLKFALNTYDILPRPAGVGVKIESAERYIFAFETYDADWNSKIGAFYRTNFEKE